MIKILFGDNRVKISQEVKKILGEGYEVVEGEEVKLEDLPSLFLGTSLFAERRKILVKDLGANKNKEIFSKVVDYVNTEHLVVIWETKLDKRTVAVKNLKKAGVEAVEYKIAETTNMKEVWDIFDVAWRDGQKAVRMLRKIETTQDPYMFFGVLASQALKKYEWRQGEKEKRVLKELSRIDKQMKSTAIMPWRLLESFLLQVSSL